MCVIVRTKPVLEGQLSGSQIPILLASIAKRLSGPPIGGCASGAGRLSHADWYLRFGFALDHYCLDRVRIECSLLGDVAERDDLPATTMFTTKVLKGPFSGHVADAFLTSKWERTATGCRNRYETLIAPVPISDIDPDRRTIWS